MIPYTFLEYSFNNIFLIISKPPSYISSKAYFLLVTNVIKVTTEVANKLVVL